MIGLGIAAKITGRPVHATLDEDGRIHGAPPDWLEEVRQRWTDIVREAALAELYRQATAAFKTIREELAEAEQAEALGVPPPGGRPSTELLDLIKQGQTAFKKVYQAVQGAAAVAEINAALEAARSQGLTWLVPEDWQAYPETCPWELAT